MGKVDCLIEHSMYVPSFKLPRDCEVVISPLFDQVLFVAPCQTAISLKGGTKSDDTSRPRIGIFNKLQPTRLQFEP